MQASAGKDWSGGHLVATLNDDPIDPESAALHHCHDLEMPVVRCFETAAERDVDVIARSLSLSRTPGMTSDLSADGLLGLLSVTYVICYEHSDYLGGSMLISNPISNLGSLGWNNRISSFKSTNGGRPKWWDGSAYSGIAWQWATSVWVPYVGDPLNDRFSSVQNVP